MYQVGKKDYHEDNKDGNGLGLFQEPPRYRKHENYETLHVQFQVPRSNFKPSILQQNTGALPPYPALFFSVQYGHMATSLGVGKPQSV